MGNESVVMGRAVLVSNTHLLHLRTADEDGVITPTMLLDVLGRRVNRPRLLPMVVHGRPESTQRAVVLVSEVEGPLAQHELELGTSFPGRWGSFGVASSRRGRRVVRGVGGRSGRFGRDLGSCPIRRQCSRRFLRSFGYHRRETVKRATTEEGVDNLVRADKTGYIRPPPVHRQPPPSVCRRIPTNIYSP